MTHTLLLTKQSLTEEHMKKRLHWNHLAIEQWSSVIWSDESRLSVTSNNNGARVIIKADERYEANILY